MTPQQQVDHLKDSISQFLGEVRGTNGGFSLEGLLLALQNLEQALNVHDCQDPAVGCSCSGSFRFPLPTTTPPAPEAESHCPPHLRFPCGHCAHDLCQDCSRCCTCKCPNPEDDTPVRVKA